MALSLKALASYVATAANFVVIVNAHVKVLPFTPPGWLVVGLGGAAVVASAVLHFIAPPGSVVATPDLTVVDGGGALGKASGEAGGAAGRGPFKAS